MRGRSEGGPAAGFTMLELVLCTMLLSVCLLPVFDLLLSETRQTGFVSDQAVALALGRSVLERFRVEPIDWLAANLATPEAGAVRIREDPLLTPGLGDGAPADFVETLKQFERQVEFQRDPDDPRKGILRSSVTWTTRQAVARRIEVAVVLADTELAGGRE